MGVASATIRPMVSADIEAAVAVSAAAFSRDLGDPAVARRWHERIAYPWQTDPDGAVVAELDGRVVGVAEAMVRERLWCLSMLAVEPGIQSGGAGRALLERSMAYGRGTDAGLIVSSNDPRALGLYARAGFAMHPTFEAGGVVDRRRLPRQHGAVSEEDDVDLETFAELTRAVRGAPYTEEKAPPSGAADHPDHKAPPSGAADHPSQLRYALRQGGRLLRRGDRGFAVVSAEGQLWVLVSRDEEAATALLWHALALTDDVTRVRWITGAQQWAIDVVAHAGLRLTAYGALCVQGRPGPLAPFLPTAPFA